jgi:hypothetical protein
MNNRQELYSKETWELYLKFMEEFFGQTEIVFGDDNK